MPTTLKEKDNRSVITANEGKGIPCVVLVDQDGKVIADSDDANRYLGPTRVLEKLEQLAK